MEGEIERIVQLEKWYVSLGRPLLEEHQPARLAELDEAITRARKLANLEHEEIAFCFVGRSGVGKSRLINALVAGKEIVLPAGGIGPLTALAMEVRFGEAPRFEAEYHDSKTMGQVLFALEQWHTRELTRLTASTGSAVAVAMEHSDELVEAPELALAETDPTGGELSRIGTFRQQAQLLVRGRQDEETELPYLLDALRFALGRESKWQVALESRDQDRLNRLKRILSTGDSRRFSRDQRADESIDGFRKDLSEHAAGFLAPLIRELRIWWPSPLLAGGLVLVDLPGVGVSGDVYKAAARSWVVDKARAIILVVDRSGVTEPDAELLRRSDFLTRLLFSADDHAADPITLSIAVTQLDSVAQTEYEKDRTRKKREHLDEIFALCRSRMKSQVSQQLQSVWREEDEALRKAKKQVIDNLVDQVRVFPLSAFQYRLFLGKDPEDPTFLTEDEQSGIPAMARGLTDLIQDVRKRAQRASDESAQRFVDQVVGIARVIDAQWQGEHRAEQEVERLRGELEEVLAPLRKEFQSRQGAFREFLRQTVPEQIRARVEESKAQAARSIRRLLIGLSTAHWATLRASVRREGTFHGARYINLPDDFAQMFVEPLAESWGRTIIQSIRKRTREFADDCVSQVEQLVEWCRGQGARVDSKLIEAQLDAIRADAKQIDSVGIPGRRSRPVSCT